MERHSYMVLFLVILLAMMAGGAIALDMQAWQGHRAEDTRIFQRATGGVGMGAIATPIWQFINYAPRILSVDDSITCHLLPALCSGCDPGRGPILSLEQDPCATQ